MLVLSRKVNERICIGDDVFVTVVGVQGNRVSLGIEAPEQIPIRRQEVMDRIKAANLTELQPAGETPA